MPLDPKRHLLFYEPLSKVAHFNTSKTFQYKHYYRFNVGETLTNNCITIFSKTNEVRSWYDDPLTCTDVQWTRLLLSENIMTTGSTKRFVFFKQVQTTYLIYTVNYIGIIYMFSRCTGNFVRLTT